MNCILIADSGSTKTDWILISSENGILEIQTTGINPVRDSQDAILLVLEKELQKQIPADYVISEIHFYGAGCVMPFSQGVIDALKIIFPQAQTTVESDLLGAARALCGKQEGIACILGTGANSCLYDGNQIVSNVPPLGFILGDEGSGARRRYYTLTNSGRDEYTKLLTEWREASNMIEKLITVDTDAAESSDGGVIRI